MDLKLTQSYFTRIDNMEPLERLISYAKLGLICNSMKCFLCEHEEDMVLNKKSAIKDGYVWKCNGTNKHEKSVRSCSIFEGLKSKMSSVLKSLNFWASNTLQITIGYELQLNKNTISSWFINLRGYIQDYFLETLEQIGGLDEEGNPKIVEIDESLFFRRKYNRGRYRDAQWVFGAVERDSTKCVMIPVQNRSSATLIPLIRRYIAPGSIIISDSWAAYNSISLDPNFEHLKINHSLNFVDPDNPIIHTQTIESCWIHAKKGLKMQHGIQSSLLNSYIYDFLFKKRFGKHSCFNN